MSGFAFLGIIVIAGCFGCSGAPAPQGGKNPPGKQAPEQGPATDTAGKQSLAEARKGFSVIRNLRPTMLAGPLPEPPAKVFIKTTFDSPAGKLATYLTPDPKDGKKHPAIIWITGGDCNSVDDSIWKPAPAKNDQTASAFRKAGIVMMFPSLRGGNDNPGKREGFFGEVNDILAAADFLAKQDHVDAKRIYLGGHSTGGTLVLLTGEYSDRFRAVFSFGPADDVGNYPPQYTPFNTSDRREVELRSPIHWLHSIKSPVFVFEGAIQGNTDALNAMKAATSNPKVHFFVVAGADHFSILAPTTRLVAEKILADDGEPCNIAFTSDELNRLVGK
jgi:dienelactone hydrolase